MQFLRPRDIACETDAITKKKKKKCLKRAVAVEMSVVKSTTAIATVFPYQTSIFGRGKWGFCFAGSSKHSR